MYIMKQKADWKFQNLSSKMWMALAKSWWTWSGQAIDSYISYRLEDPKGFSSRTLFGNSLAFAFCQIIEMLRIAKLCLFI